MHAVCGGLEGAELTEKAVTFCIAAGLRLYNKVSLQFWNELSDTTTVRAAARMLHGDFPALAWILAFRMAPNKHCFLSFPKKFVQLIS